MTIIVVGGHSRKIGKTSVAAGLIAAFPDYSWTAMKISPHEHRTDSKNSGQGESIDEKLPYLIHEETNLDGCTDTSRFLLAGARRSLWVRVKPDKLLLALPQLQLIMRSDRFVIIESNSILRHFRPDLYIIVLKFDVEDFKDSAWETLKQADAAIVINSGLARPVWKTVPPDVLMQIPLFPTTNPGIVPPGLLELVKSRLKPQVPDVL